MKKFIKSLASITLTTLATSTFAAPANYAFSAICDTSQAVATVLINSNELPILFADHLEDRGHIVTVWLSDEGTMTVTQTIGNTTCILAVGVNSKLPSNTQDRAKPITFKMLN